MRLYYCAFSSLFLLIGPSPVWADDHLYESLEHGLTEDSQPFQLNPAGHNGEEAPGQGSPFEGFDTQTPATATPAANAHAQIKPREEK